MKSWISALTLAIVTLVPGLCLVYYTNQKYSAQQEVAQQPEQPNYIATFQFEQPSLSKSLEPGVTFEVKACRVIDGHRYEMALEGGKHITAHLAVITREQASLFVVEILHKAGSKPTVTLLRQIDDHWVVDFELTFEGQRAKMTQLLRAKGLVL